MPDDLVRNKTMPVCNDSNIPNKMLDNLVCYKTMPVWNASNIPKTVTNQHNTLSNTFGKLTIIQGKLKFVFLSQDGDIVSEHILTPQDNPSIWIPPQLWHRVEIIEPDFSAQLQFYCQEKYYYQKKYQISDTHSEIRAVTELINPGKALDIGCGQGRNALYLNQLGFKVKAFDRNEDAIGQLQYIIEQEQLTNILTGVADFNQVEVKDSYDFIFSTVVLMFLQPQRIPDLIKQMQDATNVGGYNLIVSAMDSADFPCPVPFSFTFKENELKQYYQNWQIIKYNEDIGRLHKTDENGNRIALRFATILAKK